MKNLNYLMCHILYQIFKIILNILHIKVGNKTNNPSIRIYFNKIENGITFKTKTGYYFKLLTPESVKLHGSTKSKINENKNRENMPNLQTNEVM